MVIMLAKMGSDWGQTPNCGAGNASKEMGLDWGQTPNRGAGNARKIGGARQGFDVLVHDKAPLLANAESILACASLGYSKTLDAG